MLYVVLALCVQVNCYELQYNQNQLSNIVAQSQIKHDGPVLCSDISNVSHVLFFALHM